jgi:chaperonin GroEL
MSIIKEVKFKDEAKRPLIDGVNVVCDAVASTMGAKGRTVLIESNGGKPIVTKDGVSVAESIFLENPIESLGCEFVKDACRQTVNKVGDGTSQTAVLIKGLVEQSHRYLGNASSNELKKQIEAASKKVVRRLKSVSREVTKTNLRSVAIISANNDEELGGIIADAFLKAGDNGVVSYDTSDTASTYIDFIDGMPIARGWEFEGFVNNPSNRSVEFNNNPCILLSYRKITHIRELLPALEYAHKNNKELLIVSEIEYSVIQTLYANKKNGLRVAVINPPSIGEKRRDYLSDISLATNALVLDIDTSNNLEAYNIEEVLGECSRITVTKEDTVLFFSERVNSDAINARINELTTVIKNSNNNLEKEYLKDRVSKLACGVSVIKVGGNTDVEVKEKIDRVDDAIHAVRAALEMGVVSGGGSALAYVSSFLNPNNSYGEAIIKDVCLYPIQTIISNADIDLSIIDELMNIRRKNFGVDANDGRIKNMNTRGIIDPLKVVVVALENAVSAANTILTTNTTVTLKRQV